MNAYGYHVVPPGGSVPFWYNQGASFFPTDPPPGYSFVSAHFYPAFHQATPGTYEYLEVDWVVAEGLGSGIINNIAQQIQLKFGEAGEGTPLALRLFRMPIFQVEVPQQFCIPGSIPLVGGCHDIPLLGGQILATAWSYRLQMVYHNPIPAVLAVAFAIIAVIGFAVFVDEITHDTYNITQELLDAIKSSTPGGAAEDITSAFIWMAVAFGIAAYVLPTISQPSVSTNLRAGPATVGIGMGGRAGSQAPRRR